MYWRFCTQVLNSRNSFLSRKTLVECCSSENNSQHYLLVRENATSYEMQANMFVFYPDLQELKRNRRMFVHHLAKHCNRKNSIEFLKAVYSFWTVCAQRVLTISGAVRLSESDHLEVHLVSNSSQALESQETSRKSRSGTYKPLALISRSSFPQLVCRGISKFQG